MTVTFQVRGLPPKKDGANSMWRKGTELERLKALRLAAAEAMQGRPPLSGSVALELTLYSEPDAGDLDNFIAGICDGLMAAHPATPIDRSAWAELPAAARPTQATVFVDDAAVSAFRAARLPPDPRGRRYTISVALNANDVSA
jgi:hypothetical protein